MNIHQVVRRGVAILAAGAILIATPTAAFAATKHNAAWYRADIAKLNKQLAYDKAQLAKLTGGAASYNQRSISQAQNTQAVTDQVEQALETRLSGVAQQGEAMVAFNLEGNAEYPSYASVIVGKANVALYEAGAKGNFVEAPSRTVGCVVSTVPGEQSEADQQVAQALAGF